MPSSYKACSEGPDCRAVCQGDGGPEEKTAQAALPLSVALNCYTVTDDSAPASCANCNGAGNQWCECGYDYTDNAGRCVEPGATMLCHVPALNCAVSSATLREDASMWSGESTEYFDRVLRPVAQPTMGQAGYCATDAQASWCRSGPEAWTTTGARGDGTDRTGNGVSKVFASGGVRTETIDVTALVGSSCVGGCVLAQYNAGVHTNVLPGTVSLVYTCGAPPDPCGNGVVAGSEACDDGGLAAGDGCSATCAVEAGWSCSGSPSLCETDCGDGLVAGDEECDDGNQVDEDACSNACVAQACLDWGAPP